MFTFSQVLHHGAPTHETTGRHAAGREASAPTFAGQVRYGVVNSRVASRPIESSALSAGAAWRVHTSVAPTLLRRSVIVMSDVAESVESCGQTVRARQEPPVPRPPDEPPPPVPPIEPPKPPKPWPSPKPDETNFALRSVRTKGIWAT